MYTPWSGACVRVHYIGCRVGERKNAYMHAHMPALAHRVSRPRGTGSVGDSVDEGIHTHVHTQTRTRAGFERLVGLHALEVGNLSLEVRDLVVFLPADSLL